MDLKGEWIVVRTLRGPYGNNQANHLFILDKKIKKKNKNKKTQNPAT